MIPTKRIIEKYGKDRVEVDFGKDASGVRRRPYFDTDAEAEKAIADFQKDVKRGGEYWSRLSLPARQSVIQVLQEIDAAGKTPREIWEDWKRQKDTLVQTSQLVHTPYSAAVTEWKRRKKEAGKTERYIYHAAEDLMKFANGQEKRNIHEFTTEELEMYISGYRNPHTKKPWGLSSKKTIISLFSSLWVVAVNKSWASKNITEALEPITRPGRVVWIFPNATTQNLMAAAMSTELTQQVIAPLALGLFGCMRPEEVQSAKAISEGLDPSVYFGWKDIDLDNGLVTVRVEIAKTGDQRVIRLQPCALEWLKVAKKLGCPLPPENEQRLVDLCCEMIGLTDWPRDILRKCCATHLRPIYRNDYDVVKDCGNSIRILLKHYADLHVPEHVSLEHWMITPGKIEEYLKSREWGKLIRDAATASEAKQAPSASETSKPSH